MPEHLSGLMAETSVVPAVHQIEVHPYFRQSEVLAADAEHGILSQAWSPIGGITFYRDGSKGSTLEDATIREIAQADGKTPAQVMLRWHLQQGRPLGYSSGRRPRDTGVRPNSQAPAAATAGNPRINTASSR
jgi:2,5-diketo-D-gluconate reductase A